MFLSAALSRGRGAALILLATCLQVFAHDPGLSSANVEITERDVALILTFNERDIAGLLGCSIEELRAAGNQEKLEGVARRAVSWQVNGATVAPLSQAAGIDEKNNVEFRFGFPKAEAAIFFDSLLLKDLSFGHRQAFAVRDAAGKEIARQILSGRESSATMSLDHAGKLPARESRFSEFLKLGVRHILTGYDHLLFLFGLLLVCRALRPALVLITCFTIAHSLTLALSTFGLVELPSRFVEAAIAASIVYVGVENLVRRDGALRGRWILTFAFGLIHGLGFASVLRDLGIARSGAAAIVPLIAFNGGVELGQLAVAAVVLPLIWKLYRHPGFVQIGIPACSAAVAAAGAYWFIERTILS